MEYRRYFYRCLYWYVSIIFSVLYFIFVKKYYLIYVAYLIYTDVLKTNKKQQALKNSRHTPLYLIGGY